MHEDTRTFTHLGEAAAPAAHAHIAGLRYVPNYLADGDATSLLTQIDQQPWNTDLRRRVQQYGYRYAYKARTITPDMCAAPFPFWLQELAQHLHQEGYTPTIPDQVIINEYLPGQGIADHVDGVTCFSDTILSLSLGSGCEMRLTDKDKTIRIPLWLEPRSLIVFSGEARYAWRHGIPARTSDWRNGQRVPRQRRVSLTFRTVLLPPL